MPTLLGLCGVPIPKTVEGLDYSGYIRGGKNPGDGATVILCASPFGEWMRRIGGKEYRGVRTTRYTYVRDLNGPWLLYDNQTDPYQTNNLANQPKHAKLQAKLDATLTRKLKERHDEFLPGDAYIKQWGYKVDANGTAPYTAIDVMRLRGAFRASQDCREMGRRGGRSPSQARRCTAVMDGRDMRKTMMKTSTVGQTKHSL